MDLKKDLKTYERFQDLLTNEDLITLERLQLVKEMITQLTFY